MLKVTHVVGQSMNLETGVESDASIVISNGRREVMIPVTTEQFQGIISLWAELVGKSTGTVEPPAPKAQPAAAPVKNGQNGHGPKAVPAPAPAQVVPPFMPPDEEEDVGEVNSEYRDPLTGFDSV